MKRNRSTRQMIALYQMITSGEYDLNFQYEVVRNMQRLRTEQAARLYEPTDVLQILYRTKMRRRLRKAVR